MSTDPGSKPSLPDVGFHLIELWGLSEFYILHDTSYESPAAGLDLVIDLVVA